MLLSKNMLLYFSEYFLPFKYGLMGREFRNKSVHLLISLSFLIIQKKTMCSLQENRPKTISAIHTRKTLCPLDCGSENNHDLDKTNSLRAPARASWSQGLTASVTQSPDEAGRREEGNRDSADFKVAYDSVT